VNGKQIQPDQLKRARKRFARASRKQIASQSCRATKTKVDNQVVLVKTPPRSPTPNLTGVHGSCEAVSINKRSFPVVTSPMSLLPFDILGDDDIEDDSWREFVSSEVLTCGETSSNRSSPQSISPPSRRSPIQRSSSTSSSRSSITASVGWNELTWTNEMMFSTLLLDLYETFLPKGK
jgi:hypothetical protein